MKYREDLRHLCVCSVDPPGCTDIDDALHCREVENGNIEVFFFFLIMTVIIYLLLHLFYKQCSSSNSK